MKTTLLMKSIVLAGLLVGIGEQAQAGVCLLYTSAAVEARGGRVIADEIYHGLVYDDAPIQTALAYSDRVLVVNSFSKYYGMTGWRLGWLVAPDDCVADAEKLAQNLFLAASTPAQHAALAAFAPESQAVFEARRRDCLLYTSRCV